MKRAQAQEAANNSARDIDDILIKYGVELIRVLEIVDGEEVETFYTQDRYIENKEGKEATAIIANLPF